MNRHLLSLTALLVMILLAFGSVDTTSVPPTSTPSANTPSAPTPSTGSTGEAFQFKEDVFAARTKDDHTRISDLSIAKDEAGLRQMMAEGRLMMLGAGTEATLIDAGEFRSEVRILSGPFEGLSVWVSSDFVGK